MNHDLWSGYLTIYQGWENCTGKWHSSSTNQHSWVRICPVNEQISGSCRRIKANVEKFGKMQKCLTDDAEEVEDCKLCKKLEIDVLL